MSLGNLIGGFIVILLGSSLLKEEEQKLKIEKIICMIEQGFHKEAFIEILELLEKIDNLNNKKLKIFKIINNKKRKISLGTRKCIRGILEDRLK